ncbi:MAG: sialidase family protein, partial [Thermoguttaceae bacterium]
LSDGTVLGLDYRCLPTDGNDGWYVCERSMLNDDGRTFRKDPVRFFVPEAKPAMGHGPHKGPLFMRSILERRDGSLVALMAGWFKSDTALCPYGRGRPYSRTYVCESSDRGATWKYLATIGYDQIGSEGYNEASMRRLPDGQWLVVARTGNETDAKCHDNPIMRSISTDEGRTWSKPERTGVEGAFPSLAVLSDGLLVMSYGRPGAMLVFSGDNGRTWTDQTAVDTTPYSGYTDVVELSPGLLLVGFGAQGFLDPETGTREDQLRLARVRYRR